MAVQNRGQRRREVSMNMIRSIEKADIIVEAYIAEEEPENG